MRAGSESSGRGVEPRFAHYLWGHAPAWALASDQRFAYYAYVPRDLPASTGPTPVIAVIHGTLRQAEACRNAFTELADQHRCVVVAPLFPCGLVEHQDTDNYKRLAYADIRFDLILLEMVAEVARRYDIDLGRLLLHGFSGGGQFAHRFFYLHPERLEAVSIAAPGAVTLLDYSRHWWVGTRDVKQVFGKDLDLDAMRDVRVATVIGGDDSGTDEITVPVTSQHWMPGANDAGDDRQQRLAALREWLASAGIHAEHAIVPAVGHEGEALLPTVRAFFTRVLEERHAG